MDLNNKMLIISNSKIPLHFKPNLTLEKVVIPVLSKAVSMDFFLQKTFIKTNLFISTDIYTAKNWCSTVGISNGWDEKTICIEQPIKTIY